MADISGKIQPTSSINSTVQSEINVKSKLNGLSSNVESDINSTQNISQDINTGGLNISAKGINNERNLNFDFNGSSQSGHGFIHIKYSHNRPQSNEDMLAAPDEETYFIGFYSGNSSSPPENYTNYTWSQMRGNDGEQGIQGEQGPKGDSGETTLTVVNPLYFTGYLNPNRWILDTSRDRSFYKQEIEVTTQQLVSSTMTEEELIEYMNIKMTDKVTPLIELVVSKINVSLGIEQLENWRYISRAYMTRRELEDSNQYFLNFECYLQAPSIQLQYQVKVI